MAKEQALQFIIRVNAEAALRDKLQAVAKDGMAGLLSVAKAAGFDFSAEDMQAAAVEQWGSSSAEISDDALESIAGGVNGDGFNAPLPGGPGHAILIGLLVPAVQAPQFHTVKKY